MKGIGDQNFRHILLVATWGQDFFSFGPNAESASHHIWAECFFLLTLHEELFVWAIHRPIFEKTIFSRIVASHGGRREGFFQCISPTDWSHIWTGFFFRMTLHEELFVWAIRGAIFKKIYIFKKFRLKRAQLPIFPLRLRSPSADLWFTSTRMGAKHSPLSFSAPNESRRQKAVSGTWKSRCALIFDPKSRICIVFLAESESALQIYPQSGF